MADKRISQLNSHTTPSGSDLLVIVTNNETKKITYADLSSAITGSQTDISALNTFTQSIDSRVDNLESWSSSLDSTFATDLQVSIVSSSVAATIGIISQNTGLVTTASFNEYTASQSTGSLVDRLNSIENATSSYELKGSGILSGSISYNDLTNIPSGIVSQSTDLSSINTFTQSIDSRVDNLESWSSSLDDTFATDLQVSIVSSSVAATIGIISQNTGLVSTSSFNEYTASQSTASLVSRLDVLESNTGSYLTSLNGTISGSSQLTGSFDVRYSLSGSVTQTTWDNISGKPSGIISQSTDISSLNVFTASYFTNSSSFDSRLINLNSYTSSNDAWKDGVTNDVSAINVVISSLNNTYATDATLNAYTSSNDAWKDGVINDISAINGVISSLNNTYATDAEVAAGYEAKGSGIISGSSQLTSSFDERYTLSGSVVSGTTPAGTISGSSQLTASFDTRYLNAGGDGVWSGSAQVTGNLAVTSVSASVFVGGYLVPEAKFTVLSSKPMTFWPNISYELVRMTTGGGVLIGRNGETNDYGNRLDVSGSVRFTGNTTITGSLITTQGFTGSIAATNGVVSGSSQLTSSYDTRYTLSGSVQPLPNGVVSGSSQLTSSFDTRYAPSASYLTSLNGAITSSTQVLGGSGIYSSSAQLPNGVISGSSQLTASYDTRYTLSGSVVSGTTPAGTISGSAQISAFGFVSGSYTTTSSFNSFTASAQAVTTGSNSFNGTQTITGSLIITTGSFVGSQILANTSSLYLTSGSNMYVQNNGLVEITGSLVVSGSTTFTGSISISSGSITMPNRPAFRVYGLGGATTATTILSGSMTIVDYNQGGWDNTTGTFTAPIAGLYQVNLVCRTNSNSSAQAVQVIVYKNNTTISPAPNGTAQAMVEWAANTTTNHIGASTISKLAVGDTLKAIVTVGTASFDVNDNFSVAYIG